MAEGTTLAQLQQAAAELGLNPALVERAAADIARAPSSRIWTRLLGGPWMATSDETVEGHLAESDWPALLARIRETSGRVGYPSTFSGAFEWLSKEPDGLHVSIIPQAKGTRVKAVANFGGWAGAFYGLPLVISAFPMIAAAIMFAHGKPAAGLLIALAPLLLIAFGRFGFAGLCTRKRTQFDSLVREMEDWITENGRSDQQVLSKNLANVASPTMNPVLSDLETTA